MATVKANLPHEDRTSTEPRDAAIHTVLIDKIEQVNDTVRTLRLKIADQTRAVKFLPGQWLDTFIPGLPKAGGFTLTSTPVEGSPQTNRDPYLELAVQKSPGNPPAASLWRPENKILGKQLLVGVGGSFVWPPPTAIIGAGDIERAVFVAGGVGINPLISMLSTLNQTNTMPPHVNVLYSTRTDTPCVEPGRILFLQRLMAIEKAWPESVKLTLFLTGNFEQVQTTADLPWHHLRRINKRDLAEALGEAKTRIRTVSYVCGPPRMTDEVVQFLGGQEGMDPRRVFCEKWW